MEHPVNDPPRRIMLLSVAAGACVGLAIALLACGSVTFPLLLMISLMAWSQGTLYCALLWGAWQGARGQR
jgi:hypothetical protein